MKLALYCLLGFLGNLAQQYSRNQLLFAWELVEMCSTRTSNFHHWFGSHLDVYELSKTRGRRGGQCLNNYWIKPIESAYRASGTSSMITITPLLLREMFVLDCHLRRVYSRLRALLDV